MYVILNLQFLEQVNSVMYVVVIHIEQFRVYKMLL